MILRLVLMVLIIGAGCGGNSETSQSEGLEKLTELVVWPADGGPPRDLAADSEACKEKLTARADYAERPDIMQLIMHFDCLQKLGWETHGETDPRG